MKPADIGRLVRTVHHIPASQQAHRIRLRAQRAWYTKRPGGLAQRWAAPYPASGGWPAAFEPIDLAVAHPEPTAGRFRVLGENHDVLSGGWRPAERSQLFRYHLHYFDWAWPLAARATPAERDHFARIFASWQAGTQPGRWDEWSPYVVSLRAWALCGVYHRLVRGSGAEAEVIDTLRSSLGYLERNLELDVGGNHLIKNLKAVIGLGVFLAQPDSVERALHRLRHQLAIQVGRLGGHFELSPGYHAQVLGDLVDIAGLLDAAHITGTAQLHLAIRRMGRWLATVSYPDGTLPLLGDTVPPPDGFLSELRRRLGDEGPMGWPLLDTGHVVLRPRPEAMVVFDFGQTCPPELPAHAQADWGTFELWVAGRRIVVDPGVSTYVGPRRQWERSTAAHNTVCVSGHDHSEVWGSFRAGALARCGNPTVTSHNGVTRIDAWLQPAAAGLARRRPPIITRSVASDRHRLVITDHLSAPPQEATSSINLTARRYADAVQGSGSVSETTVTVGAGFGSEVPAVRCSQRTTGTSFGWTLNLDRLVALATESGSRQAYHEEREQQQAGGERVAASPHP